MRTVFFKGVLRVDPDKIDFPIFGIFTKTLSTEIKRRSKRTKIWEKPRTQTKSCYARRVGGLEPNAIASDRPPNRSHMNTPKTTGNQAGEEFCLLSMPERSAL